MTRTCSRCGPGDPAFPSVPPREYTVTEAEAAAEYWFCPKCREDMAHPKSLDALMEEAAAQEQAQREAQYWGDQENANYWAQRIGRNH